MSMTKPRISKRVVPSTVPLDGWTWIPSSANRATAAARAAVASALLTVPSLSSVHAKSSMYGRMDYLRWRSQAMTGRSSLVHAHGLSLRPKGKVSGFYRTPATVKARPALSRGASRMWLKASLASHDAM